MPKDDQGLEPATPGYIGSPELNIQHSIAISLRRIADALDRGKPGTAAGAFGPPVTVFGRGQ